MLYAVRGNKQLKIEQTEMTTYLNLGYDIAEEVNGQLSVIEVNPSKVVTYAEYKRLIDENEVLKEKLQNVNNTEEIEALQKEIKDLKSQLVEAKKPAKADK
jgi:uncharacterized membrane protein YcaP (DUF421 family)